jgi:hypothetical protein
MNTGIQDVANLAWKLAAVRAGAPEALLDSYDAERGAVGEALLATTSRGLAAVTSANPIVERIRDALASFAVKFEPVVDRLVGFVSETAITYRGSPAVRDAGGAGTLHAGDRAPDADLVGKTRLLAPLRDARALALVVDGAVALARELLPETHVVSLGAALLDPHARAAYGTGTLVVVRPDGYVGYRGPAGDRDALLAYAALVSGRVAHASTGSA